MMNERAQSLIEVETFFMALSVLLAALLGFTRWMAIREKLLLAAKQGALLYSSGHVQRAVAEQEMRRFLTSGSPVLDPGGIAVSIHSRSGIQSWWFELDEVFAEYTAPKGWYPLLGLDSRIRETCVIKNAAHYWLSGPFPGGPAVPYGR
jgi:hypothetical protein